MGRLCCNYSLDFSFVRSNPHSLSQKNLSEPPPQGIKRQMAAFINAGDDKSNLIHMAWKKHDRILTLSNLLKDQGTELVVSNLIYIVLDVFPSDLYGFPLEPRWSEGVT